MERRLAAGQFDTHVVELVTFNVKPIQMLYSDDFTVQLMTVNTIGFSIFRCSLLSDPCNSREFVVYVCVKIKIIDQKQVKILYVYH